MKAQKHWLCYVITIEMHLKFMKKIYIFTQVETLHQRW